MDAMLTVRLDKDVKEKATKTLRQKGLTPSTVVQQLFDLIVKTGDVPFQIEATPLSAEEKERRVNALSRFHTKQPMQLTDDEIRAARLKDKYDIDAG